MYYLLEKLKHLKNTILYKKSIIISVLLVLGMSQLVTAQKRKDLLDNVAKLETELAIAKEQLVESERKVRVGETKVESMKLEVENIKKTNESLLANMGGFTQLSEQKSKNLEKSLETIKQKDKQLDVISESLSRIDSTKLATYEIFKAGLKESIDNAQVSLGFQNGVITIAMPNEFLFGLVGTSIVIEEKAKLTIGKIGAILNEQKDLNIQVISNTNELTFVNSIKDNWDLSSLQASAISRSLQTDSKVESARIEVVAKEGEYKLDNVKAVTKIIVTPGYKDFYKMVKDIMKN